MARATLALPVPALSSLLLALLPPAPCTAQAAQAPQAAPAAPVALPSEPVDAPLTDRRWLRRQLAELAGPCATVVFFAGVGCPIVQRYLPRIGALAREREADGVRVLVVNTGPGDGLVEAAAQQVELAPAASFAKDFDGALARALGVERTATAVVLDGARRIVYRGRVDRQYRYAGAAPDPGRADLAEAVADVLAGRPVAVASTPVEGCRITAAPPAPPAEVPTFARDVAPLLHRHCQDCHRPGGEGPFALGTFDEVHRHLQMVGEVVDQQRMPPWYGSPRHGEFANVRGLSAAERQTILAWVAAGGPAGTGEAPLPPRPPAGRWRIAAPDLVLRVPVPVRLPAEGYVPYKYFVLPHRFERDTWVEAIEIRSEDGRVLHHCNLARVRWGEPFSQDGFVTGQVPGGDAMVLDPGTAVRIPAGSALALQAHYVTVGEPVVDRLETGLRFARGRVDKELRVCIVSDRRFRIPPGASAHPVAAQRRLRHAARGIGLFVHMHLRGRDMTVRAVPPEGGPETLLVVPNYNFDWQQSYRWGPAGRLFPAGTVIAAEAHYDNSAGNPFNPDPAATVGFGLQTLDEMMYAFLFYVRDDERLGLAVDPATGHVVE